MKAQFWYSVLLLTVAMSARSYGQAPTQSGGKVSLLPKISSELTGPEGQLLMQVSTEFLENLRRSLPMPKSVRFVPADEKGARYDDGRVYVEMPMVRKTPRVQIEKSVDQSIPISLHEIMHQLTETYINIKFANRPEIKWLFEYEHFAALDEFLADVIPVLFLKDPKAISNNLAEHLEQVRDSQYGFTLPTKVFIWRNVFPRMVAQNLSLSEVSRKIFEATFNSYEKLTNGYSQEMKIETKSANGSLISHLCKEFSISPCLDPIFNTPDYL